jgi:cytochrome c oxidase subunit IV
MTHEPAHQPLDQTDPHHEGHHKHVIMRMSTLVGVLTVLLLLTILTVGQAQVEAYASVHWGVHLPQIFNVAVVMAIAVVKGSLVALYFMQLRYDNPVNAIIFLFCLGAVGLFLGFTMIDLGTRGIVSPIKAPEIQAGGLGIVVEGKVNTADPATGRMMSLVESARRARIDLISERAAQGLVDLHGMSPEEYYEKKEKPIFTHHGAHGHADAPVSDPNMHRPPQPRGAMLFVPAAGDHGHH